MDKLTKVVKTAKTLIDLPYNCFNLENYNKILTENFGQLDFIRNPNLPTQLMSGNNPNAGIVKTLGKGNVYIIGKGLLFDSGGYNLKTGREGSYGMHGDKAGGIIALSVATYLKKNVIAYCPFTTNFLHTSKIIPGDIIKIGKNRVVVNNTDAEGRLVLAEALSTLVVKKDDTVITIATLTGCCEYAIDKATGVFSPNNDLLKKYAEAAYEADELAWALPMFEYMDNFYKKQPIKNAEDRIKAGASEGAMFVKQFVKFPNRWIHLDIAPSAHINNVATGEPIKSLVNFINKLNYPKPGTCYGSLGAGR